MQSFLPAPNPLSLSTKSIGGKSLATLSQKSPSPNLHGRQSPVRGYSHNPSLTPPPGPYLLLYLPEQAIGGRNKASFPICTSQLLPSTSRNLPGPSHPESAQITLARQFLGQLSQIPRLELWPAETSQADTTKVPTPAQSTIRRGRKVLWSPFPQSSLPASYILCVCVSNRTLTTIHRDMNPNCWIQMMVNPCRSPTSNTSLVEK